MKVALISLCLVCCVGVCASALGAETPNPYQPPPAPVEVPLELTSRLVFDFLLSSSHSSPRSQQEIEKLNGGLGTIRLWLGRTAFEKDVLSIGARRLATLDLELVAQLLAFLRPQSLRRLRHDIPTGLEKDPFSELLNLCELYASGSVIESNSFFPRIGGRSLVLAGVFSGGGAAGISFFEKWLNQLPGPTLFLVLKSYLAGALATLLASAAYDMRPIVVKLLAVRQFNEAVDFAMKNQLSVAPEIQMWKQDRTLFLDTCQARILEVGVKDLP